MTCPVPKDQQPLNEYIELKEAFFYRWAKSARSQYMRVLLLIWLGFTAILAVHLCGKHWWIGRANFASITIAFRMEPCEATSR